MLSWMSVIGSSFLKPEFWFEKAGSSAIFVVTAIIFAESGLLFGFFFPGDSLLFFTGFLTSSAANKSGSSFHDFAQHVPALPIVLLCMFLAAVIGDQCGYWFGRRVGPSLFRRPNSRLFKQENVLKAQSFFERHGAKSIVLARFVPIVRTFTPVVAGVGKMRYRTYLKFDLLGALLWAVGVTTLGHFLGEIEFVRKNIEYAIVAVIAVSLLPVAVEVLRARRHRKPADVPA
jgi:membrane-associated protein